MTQRKAFKPKRPLAPFQTTQDATNSVANALDAKHLPLGALLLLGSLSAIAQTSTPAPTEAKTLKPVVIKETAVAPEGKDGVRATTTGIGKGNQALGAPNLTDKVWLHGWGEEAVIAMINQGKVNVMPPQASRITPEQLKVLTAYVLNLSQITKVAAQ